MPLWTSRVFFTHGFVIRLCNNPMGGLNPLH